MKNGIIFMIFMIAWTVIKLIFKLLAVIVKVLASLIVFFGLYIPLFYGVFGIILLVATDFTFGGTGTDQVLYYVGFGLCCVASVIISVRNLIVRPLSAVFAPLAEYREEVKRARHGIRKDGDEEEATPQAYRDPRGYDPRYGGQGGYAPYGEQYPDRYAGQPYGDGYRPHAPYYEDPRSYEQPPAYRREERPQGGYMPYREDDYGRNSRPYAPIPERPLIYYSKRRPGVLVKEYSDRFELFEEADGTRRYIGTEYKDE